MSFPGVVPGPGNTLAYIIKKVRRLTASSSNSTLTTDNICEAINTAYQNDFPYAIKLDQQRSVYKFLTIPNVDRYPVDANNNQGFRAPVYFEGIQGNFFKNRDQLYNLYPRYPTQFQRSPDTISGVITNVDLTGASSPAGTVRIVSPAHGLPAGSFVTINGVLGTTELNGQTFEIELTANQVNSFNLSGTNVADFSAYISGGAWITTDTTIQFSLFGNNVNPFPSPNMGILSTQVIIGGIDINGNPIRIIDDGGAVVNGNGIGSNTTKGKLLFLQQNNVGNNVYLDNSSPPVQQPAIPNLSPLGQSPSYNPSYPAYPPTSLTNQYCGTVNYITTEITIQLSVPVMPGTQLNIWAATYNSGRPYNILFWNNELTIRPVPDNVYLVELETYLTPVQFLQFSDNPVLNQWAQYIAYIAAMEILRDRQDFDGVENLREGMMRQEALVLERQSIEEINQPNITMFNSTQIGNSSGGGWGVGQGF